MMEIKDAITDLAELDRMYPQPASPSIRKVTQRLTEAYRRMIDASPFVAVATGGVDGLDCSPRGDIAGFVRVADEQTILLPERRGNNRIDSVRNLISDPRIALLFLVPGIQETVREWPRNSQPRSQIVRFVRCKREYAAGCHHCPDRDRLLPMRARDYPQPAVEPVTIPQRGRATDGGDDARRSDHRRRGGLRL